MGFGPAFDYASPAEIFAEHAALSSFENASTRAFDLGALAGLDRSGFEAMEPFEWPQTSASQSPARMFADGHFFTPDGKARFVEVRASSQSGTSPGFPLTLNTGRLRDHWHTMTRSGKSARLSQHCAEPYMEIHPRDAARHHIGDADLVRVSTGLGAILVRALISPRQQPGSIFVPMHWNDQFAARARADVLAAAVTDPISGQPASKNIPARIERFVAATYGFAVLHRKTAHIEAEYWAMVKCAGGWRVELAFAANSPDWPAFATALVGGDASEMAAYHDIETGRYRFACYEGGRLAGAIFLAPEPVAVSRDWAIAQLSTPGASRSARLPAIAGRPGKGTFDRGPTVCSCFGVGANEIAAAAVRGCTTVAAIGEALQAGTNCGSCRAEIRDIIDAQRSTKPALAEKRARVASV
jgi:assimilatory nitrate reductase catalytic subunit